MTYLIWGVWMIHQFFLLIVYLNFFIANISQVYDYDLANTIQNEYTQKAQMNREAEPILRFLGLITCFEFYILTGAVKDTLDENLEDLQGIVVQLKQNQKHESAALAAKIDKVDTKIDKVEAAMDAKMTAMNANLEAKMDMILAKLN